MAKTASANLMERDKQFIQACVEMGYLTVDMAQKFFYKNSAHVVRRRLLKLERAKYIDSFFRAEGMHSKKLFIPNNYKTHTVLARDKLERLIKVRNSKPWRRHLFEHEDTVRNVALLLKQFDFRCEIDFDFTLNANELGNYRDRLAKQASLPDLIYTHCDGNKINFEIELSAKSKIRYERKLYDIQWRQKVPTIYLVKNLDIKTIIDPLIDSEPSKYDNRKPTKVFICHLDQFKNRNDIEEIINRALDRTPRPKDPTEGMTKEQLYNYICPKKPNV